MPSNALMSMFGITQEFGIDVFRIIVALSFLSVGYLLFKRARPFASERKSLNADPPEIPCLTARNYPSAVM
jgi:hypothetical protein